MKKTTFTLIEILVVMTIISILAGLAFRHITDSIRTAKQAESAENLRQMANLVLNRQMNARGIHFTKPFNDPTGIRTLNAQETIDGDLFIGGEFVFNTDPNFKTWATFSGNHPLDPMNGYYVFHGIESSGNLKKRLDSETRIAMEVFDWTNEGLGRAAVAFADGHVKLLNVTTPFGELDIAQVLSTKGENNGEL